MMITRVLVGLATPKRDHISLAIADDSSINRNTER